MYSDNDTICAIATATGQSAISMIRISGPATFGICQVITHQKLEQLPPTHTVSLRKIYDQHELIDEVLLTVFHSPKSYTGEDLAEISCHGSAYITQRIMKLLVKEGARLAKPGEFTQRAFLNGKMDLSQAEAVADLIASQSSASHQVALNQMRGGFSHQLTDLRSQLLHFASLIELELDFSEEDVEFASRAEFRVLITNVLNACKVLASSFGLGNAIKNGVPVAIAGKPNSGKSTLLNALLNDEKAIVSEIPGTTRDSIEDTINVKGILVRFIDTAGIRETSDEIETQGIARTFQQLQKASLILLVCDITDNLEEIHSQLKKITLSDNQQLAIILNKSDTLTAEELSVKILNFRDLPYPCLAISAKFRRQLDKIESFILDSIEYKNLSDNAVIVTNLRHFEALNKTITAGNAVVEALNNHLPTDLLAEDIREMMRSLGEITSNISTDEVLGNIFKNFCIGK